jgi:tRNA(adenine34) deaminase
MAAYEPAMRAALEEAAAAAATPQAQVRLEEADGPGAASAAGAAGAAEEPGAAGAAGEADVPVGAVILDAAGSIIARARNRREAETDPTGHAEIVAIRQAAAALRSRRLDHCMLVVTLEPCAMCAGAVIAARLGRLVYGAADPKAGAAGSAWDLVRDPRLGHSVEVIGGVLAADCAGLLSDFFRQRR